MSKGLYNTSTIIIQVPELGEEFECCVYGTYRMVDNGIGHYECHGYRGYDTQIEPEVDEILLVDENFTKEQKEVINAYIEDNFDALIDRVLDEDTAHAAEDGPDPDDARDLEEDMRRMRDDD
jgi:hypothetical protein